MASMVIITDRFLFLVNRAILLYFQSKMSKTVNVEYFAETVFAKEPQKAKEESAGYDLYAAEAKTILPGKNELVYLDFC